MNISSVFDAPSSFVTFTIQVYHVVTIQYLRRIGRNHGAISDLMLMHWKNWRMDLDEVRNILDVMQMILIKPCTASESNYFVSYRYLRRCVMLLRRIFCLKWNFLHETTNFDCFGYCNDNTQSSLEISFIFPIDIYHESKSLKAFTIQA